MFCQGSFDALPLTGEPTVFWTLAEHSPSLAVPLRAIAQSAESLGPDAGGSPVQAILHVIDVTWNIPPLMHVGRWQYYLRSLTALDNPTTSTIRPPLLSPVTCRGAAGEPSNTGRAAETRAGADAELS
jgi:hypothetical protein